MAEPYRSTDQSTFQPEQSQRSFARTLASTSTSTSTSTSHRRIASDDVSTSSGSQTRTVIDASRPVSASSEPRQWLPIMGATGPASSSVLTSTTGWSGEGDLGSQPLAASHDISSNLSSRPYHKADGFQNSPGPSSKAPRPKPVPMQFEDVPMDYYSPSGSSQFTFSPRGRFQHSRTSSHAHLLNTPTTTTWRSPRTPPPYTTATLPRKWWHWRPVWSMYMLFLFGVACALGHHIFFKSLHGKPADAQIVMLRYGTVLSFGAKAGLVAAVVAAFKQRIWTTVRSKFLSVGALDSLFAATDDMSALLNFEIYRQAKVAMILAVFVWLTPVMIILTSNTLTVKLALRVDNTTCLNVRNLNFTRDQLEEFRRPTKIDGLYGKSLSLWNTTSSDTTSPNWFDYYAGPSNPLIRVTTQAAFTGEPTEQTRADVDICGSGWNCSYTINFTAPAYQCSELASGVGSKVKKLGEQQAPDGFDTTLLVPEGNYSYYAFTNGGDYAAPQMNGTGAGGVPTTQPPFPEALGAFRTEPVIWVGYSVINNLDEAVPLNRSESGWDDAFTPKVIGCEHHEAHYVVTFNLIGGRQFTNVTERKLLRRVMNTTWIQGEGTNDGTNDNTTAYPKSGYVYPRDVHHYRRVAAYHAMGSQLRSYLEGTVDSSQIDAPVENTKADQTTLLNQRQDYFPSANLAELIPKLYEAMVLSMFSEQQFVSVVWAAKPSESSGKVAGDDSTRYPCMKSRLENVYDYHERDLWIVYSLTILLAVVGIALGTLAILENEWVLRNTRFSNIVAATRGPALEKLGWVGEDDRGDLPRDVKSLKVGYGIVHRASGLGVLQQHTGYNETIVWDGGDVRYGFGLEGDVRQPRSQTRRQEGE